MLCAMHWNSSFRKINGLFDRQHVHHQLFPIGANCGKSVKYLPPWGRLQLVTAYGGYMTAVFCEGGDDQC